MVLNLSACNGGGGGGSGSEGKSEQAIQIDSLVTEFMSLVNAHRKKIGLKALSHSNEMALIALEHSQNMAAKKVSFGHGGFSGRCSEARTAMDGGNLCAENVASGQKTAQAVFTAWLNSASHRANIENPRLTHCGLGIALTSTGTPYWTHLFLEKN